MKKTLLFIVIVVITMFIYLKYFASGKLFSPLGNGKIINNENLGQYSYTALRLTKFSGSPIKIGKVLKDSNSFISYVFYYNVSGKKVSGLLDIPKKSGNYPVVIMIRGYVDPKIYQPGVGTSHDSEYLAQNGFITMSPDFLGYGLSDKGSTDPMEDRFLTYVTTLELIYSVNNLNKSLTDASLSARFDGKHIGIWGHSNGGQIALSVMEISGYSYPTVLWAPVSKSFPYDILYYTDESDDHGKSLIKLVADFESQYNAEKYSLTNYLDWIKAPIQIDQGTADEEVPQSWSNSLVASLKKLNKSVEYFTYPGEDHNFDQGSWDQAIEQTTSFYKKQFSQSQ